MKRLILPLSLMVLSAASFAGDLKLTHTKIAPLIPEGASEAVWESDCTFGMKGEIHARNEVKEATLKLKIFIPGTNCSGEALSILSTDVSIQFSPDQMKRINSFSSYAFIPATGINDQGDKVLLKARYKVKRGRITLDSDKNSSLTRVFGVALDYFQGCIGSLPAEGSCNVHNLNQTVNDFGAERISMITPNQLFIDIDDKIPNIRFSLKETK